ncbi:MAG: thiosulfate oxidation carrier complex protein SoxZ [Alphaproteobacteria bacterium]
MAEPVNPRIRAPRSARRGEVVEIKTLVTHPMESGQRRDAAGKAIPRKILKSFVCTLNGAQAFAVDLEPAISANPYFAFHLRIDGPSDLAFAWTDDDGTVYRAEHRIALA